LVLSIVTWLCLIVELFLLLLIVWLIGAGWLGWLCLDSTVYRWRKRRYTGDFEVGYESRYRIESTAWMIDWLINSDLLESEEYFLWQSLMIESLIGFWLNNWYAELGSFVFFCLMFLSGWLLVSVWVVGACKLVVRIKKCDVCSLIFLFKKIWRLLSDDCDWFSFVWSWLNWMGCHCRMFLAAEYSKGCKSVPNVGLGFQATKREITKSIGGGYYGGRLGGWKVRWSDGQSDKSPPSSNNSPFWFPPPPPRRLAQLAWKTNKTNLVPML